MELFGGIDVAKDTLAVALSSGEEWSCTNDAGGIRLLVQRLNAAGPVLVVSEATGGYRAAQGAGRPAQPIAEDDYG